MESKGIPVETFLHTTFREEISENDNNNNNNFEEDEEYTEEENSEGEKRGLWSNEREKPEPWGLDVFKGYTNFIFI